MAGLGPEIVADIVAACGAGAAAAGESLAKVLGTAIEVTVGEAGSFDAAAPPEGFDGGALVVLVKEEKRGAVLVLPAASGLVPDWCADPSDEEKSKLGALAEGMCESLFGESVLIDFFKAEHVANLGEALTQAEVAADAAFVPLELKGEDDKAGAASLIWPLDKPDEIFAAAASEESAAEEPAASEAAPAAPEPAPAAPAAASAPAPTPEPPVAGRTMDQLPPYMQSLMKIEIPLSTTLANSKQKVSDITNLGPGAILQFDKGCDELLDLYAGGQLIARGVAVKVGDKFGLQIKHIELPEERFNKLCGG